VREVGELKHEKPNEQIQETAALYALGVLTQHESQAFEAHLLEGCSVCEQELKRFEEIVAALGLGAEPRLPPAYLRDLLIARIQRESRLSVTHRAKSAIGDIYPTDSQSQAGAAQIEQLPAAEPRSFFKTLLPWALAASIAIVALILFAQWRRAEQNISDQRRLVAELRAETDQLRLRLDRQENRSRELEQINAVLSTPGYRVIPLRGLQPAPGASGRVYWDTQRNRWLVVVDLPPAPPGKVYQLWFIAPDDRKISMGLLKTDDTGHATASVEMPPGLGQPAATAITLEPEGGSAQPTLPIYAMGRAG
jgi:anti-sigma-K factor RskA